MSPYGVPADYVPFYYAPRSPMLYKISRGGVRTYQDGQSPLVYLVTSVASAVATGQPCVYSDGNCAHGLTNHYADVGRMHMVIDWGIMRARQWANTADDGDRMRRRMAEFLVHRHLPTSALHAVATYDENHAGRVRCLLEERGYDIPVSVRRDWYY